MGATTLTACTTIISLRATHVHYYSCVPVKSPRRLLCDRHNGFCRFVNSEYRVTAASCTADQGWASQGGSGSIPASPHTMRKQCSSERYQPHLHGIDTDVIHTTCGGAIKVRAVQRNVDPGATNVSHTGSTGPILLWIPSRSHYSESEPEWLDLGSTDSRDGLWSVGR